MTATIRRDVDTITGGLGKSAARAHYRVFEVGRFRREPEPRGLEHAKGEQGRTNAP
jgi:hypothetical protein